MSGRLISVNTSLPKVVAYKGQRIETSIFKKQRSGPVKVEMDGLQADTVADKKNHGRPFQAVYLYPWENYEYWRKRLNLENLQFGHFGENLTTVGLQENQVCIGDVISAGTATLQVTAHREPCNKLNMRMNDDGFSKTFLRSRRLGFYLRVISPGVVKAGDAVEITEKDTNEITVDEFIKLLHFDKKNHTRIKRVLKIPSLELHLRDQFEALLKAE